MDLPAYRLSAETFLCELTADYYRHHSGLKDDYELEPIYDRHPELFTRRAVDELRTQAANAPVGSERRRRHQMLVDFAIDGLIGQATKGPERELARREARLGLSVNGERIGFRESAVVQANEAAAERRAEIEAKRLELIAGQLNPLYREVLESRQQIEGAGISQLPRAVRRKQTSRPV